VTPNGQAGVVRYRGMNGPSSEATEGPLMTRFGHWVAASGVDWLPFPIYRPVQKC
jgi:hypothetical protein